MPVDPFPKIEVKGQVSTQAGFGRVLDEIARAGGPLADRIVTTSPDVTVSTNLGPWVNRRGLFSMASHEDVFKQRGLLSPQKWEMGPRGQHFELGIAEMNLFLMLAALGLSHSLFGERLLPVGTLYDPVRVPRPRCAELRLLPGLALHGGRHARPASRWRRRAARTSRSARR